MKNNRQYLAYLAALGFSVIFGLSFMFTKDALSSFSLIQLLSYRFALAALVLTLLCATGLIKVKLKGKPLKFLIVLSLFQPIAYFIFETFGVKLTSSSEAGMMIALIPIIVTILAVIFLGERPNIKQSISIVVSVLGVLFIILMSSGGLVIGNHFWGMLCLLGAVFSGGVYNILSRKLSESFTPVEITFVMMWVGAIIFNAAGLFQGLMGHTPGLSFHSLFAPSAIVPILYLGIVSSICAFFMVNYSLSKLPASRSAVFANLTTIISILAGVLIKHESFHWYQLVGGIMIILGVWGTNFFHQTTEKKASASEAF